MFLNMDLQDEGAQVAAAEQQLTAEPQTPAKTPMTRKKKIILIVSACAVVVAAAIAIILILKEVANSAKYDQAIALMESNDLLQAKEEFLTINGYKDSADKARECQNKYDFNSADTLLRSEDYAAARDGFAALGDYSTAHDKINECDYAIAANLLKNGEPEKAKEAFLALGEYSDSVKRADECQNEMDYIAAAKLLDGEDYTGALKAFFILKGYKDSVFKTETCRKYIDYARAEQLLKDGKFCDAYNGFKALGTFEDAAARMTECIQSNPIPGEIYRNPDFKKKARALIIKSPNDGYLRCFKVYKGNTLISTIFISGGKKVTVKIPSGTYTIKYAVGTNWFGKEDMFGDEGYYCKFEKKYNFVKYYWTFDFRETVRGDFIDKTELDRASF